MPSHRTHRILEKRLLGKTYPEVHRMLDSTTGISGSSHRNDIVHNPLFIYLMTHDMGAFKAAVLHNMLDQHVTKIKRKAKNPVMRTMLDML